MLKSLRALALAFGLIATPVAVHADQADYEMPLTGPMSFPTFLSTWLNPALQAIITNNSGATSPTTTGQPETWQWWVDTSGADPILKIYDGTAWLSLATFDDNNDLVTLNGRKLILTGSTSGTTTLQASAVAGSTTLTLPAATDTLVGKATTDTFTNKTFDTAGTGNSFSINGTAITAVTGTGSAVLATSPTLVTPALGTPSSVTLTNGTGLPISTGVTGLGADVATFLGTPSSANLATAITDETGSGLLVFGTSPTITLENGTGLPISTGVSGLGAGIGTFLATPSSANLASALTDETGSGVAVFGTSPTIATPVLNGTPTGTGVASAATASTLALRDANANLSADSFIAGYTTTATAAGTTTLTVNSTELQFFTGATTQTVELPVTSTLVLGQRYTVVNNSSGTVTVNSSGGNLVLAVASGNTGIFTTILTSGTSAASWSSTYISSGAGTGTVTSVATGTGLTGGPITTTGTVDFAVAAVGTWAATPSSENLAAAITDETGSGAAMFGTSPTITTDITVPNTGLHLLDTNASHDLIIAPGSNITADRTLTITTGDANVPIDLTDAGSDKLLFWDDSAPGWTALTLPANLVVSGTSLRAYEVWGGAISDETTTITTGTGKLSFSIPYAFNVVGVYGTINTASSSGTPTFDINEAGVTILSTKIVIDVSEFTDGSAGYQGTGAAAVISDSSLAAFSQITVDIDTAGTGAKGAKVFIIGYP